MLNQVIKVLYLEDEPYLGKIVKESLESRGFDIQLINHGDDVISAFMRINPDLCLLDVMVPGLDGFSIGKAIRKKSPAMPIIFLTAKNQTTDVLQGFKSGGNDYIKKPFSMEELIVRMNNLVRINEQHLPKSKNDCYQIGQLEFYPGRFRLESKSGSVDLSHRENELILAFAKHINQKVDRRNLLNDIWGDDSIYNSRNLDVYVRKLRAYFELDPNIEIKTLRGVGYHFIVKSAN